MAIIAIIKTQPTGSTAVEEFRLADTANQAVNTFCNDYEVPLNPSDYTGFDTEWTSVPSTSNEDTLVWGYDFDTSAMVEVPAI